MAEAKKTEEEQLGELQASAAADFPPNDPKRYGHDGRLGFLLKLSAAIEKRVEFESSWIGQRMTWLVISQSFLFGAFAQAASRGDNELLIFLKWLIVLIALVQVVFAYLAILAAKQVGTDLLVLRSRVDAAIRAEPGLGTWPILGTFRTGLSRGSFKQGGLASQGIPITLFCAWVILLGAMLYRWVVFGEP